MKGIIYAAREKSTGKFYIGLTFKGITERKLDHFYKAKNGSTKEFHSAIKKNGINSFSWVVLDVGDNPNELATKERYFIMGIIMTLGVE